MKDNIALGAWIIALIATVYLLFIQKSSVEDLKVQVTKLSERLDQQSNKDQIAFTEALGKIQPSLQKIDTDTDAATVATKNFLQSIADNSDKMMKKSEENLRKQQESMAASFQDFTSRMGKLEKIIDEIAAKH